MNFEEKLHFCNNFSKCWTETITRHTIFFFSLAMFGIFGLQIIYRKTDRHYYFDDLNVKRQKISILGKYSHPNQFKHKM